MNAEKRKYERPSISKEQLEASLLEVNQKLLEANQMLQKADEARMELFTNLSHDLRSPMAALVSSVEYLQTADDIGAAKRKEVLGLMGRRLRQLQGLVNDLFLLTKIENPTIALSIETVDAEMFLESFFYETEADPKYQNREMEIELADNLSVPVAIDTEQMVRVLDNLFSNALRYSADGARIVLKASAAGEMVEVTVSDTGMGIGSEDLPHIFERSYRASRSRTPGDGGSGLGLAIAKGIVEKHGGTITCESVLGEGSSFHFTMPIQRGEN